MNNPTFVLECWNDDLNTAQEEEYEKVKNERKLVTEKIKELMVKQGGEDLFIGEIFSAYELNGRTEALDAHAVKLPKKVVKKVEAPVTSSRKRQAAIIAASQIVIDDDEDEEDIPISKRFSKKERDLPSSASSKSMKSKSKLSRNAEKEKEKEKDKFIAPLRPSEETSIGGLSIGSNTNEIEKSNVESKEGSTAKFQGRTFPSLVVVVKPFFKVKESSSTERSLLDSKVKTVLMLNPAKFTEWLIQQGLLKSGQQCAVHTGNSLKLGVYSDVSKFPYSGGYVWISDCCPSRFTSVFKGSLFEGAPHPPSCILKIIYHWACQTNIPNIMQWVKVDNVYIKNVYTWLRAICTLALKKHFRKMGGQGKYVEVGVISLGTTAQDGQQRQVKVEVLGVLDHAEKVVRLRAVEPITDGDRSFKKRFVKILEPLNDWVSKDSIVTIDLTVDKQTLHSMGFKYVLQVSQNDVTAKQNNSAIMDYLRRVVPRLFQNTLSLLSRPMIQQFLDELAWREEFGTYALQAFDNITTHLAEQTRIDSKESLNQILYQVALNPFKNWTEQELCSISALPTKEPMRYRNQKSSKESTISSKESSEESVEIISSNKSKTSISSRKDIVKKPESREKGADRSSENQTIEEIYYGILQDEHSNPNIDEVYNLNFECPDCKEVHTRNSQLQIDLMRHIDIDVHRIDCRFQCRYCLEKLPSDRGLKRHEVIAHASLTKHPNSVSYNCLICQTRFNSIQLLSGHMQKVHVPMELPFICYACGYRSSSHHNLIQHFYIYHENQNMLQCPICLMVFWISINGSVLQENINLFLSHLKRHFEKSNAKKCNKCVLSFITKGELKYHSIKDHQSLSGNKNIKKLTDGTLKISAPRQKPHSLKTPQLFKPLQDLSSLKLNIHGGKSCLECDRDLTEPEHFSGLNKCYKCEYKTCCMRGLMNHVTGCQTTVNPVTKGFIPLEREMHCVCGFSDSEGNSMARHLAVCEHKSAYPSVEAAQENTVKRNMLDMLGLVRREDENESINKETVQDSD